MYNTYKCFPIQVSALKYIHIQTNTSPEHAPQLNCTYSIRDFTTPAPEVSSSVADNYSLPDEDVSLESAIVNLSSQEEMADTDRQIDAFIDKVVDNSTEWTFVSLITLMPLRCSAVKKVVGRG